MKSYLYFQFKFLKNRYIKFKNETKLKFIIGSLILEKCNCLKPTIKYWASKSQGIVVDFTEAIEHDAEYAQSE